MAANPNRLLHRPDVHPHDRGSQDPLSPVEGHDGTGRGVHGETSDFLREDLSLVERPTSRLDEGTPPLVGVLLGPPGVRVLERIGLGGKDHGRALQVEDPDPDALRSEVYAQDVRSFTHKVSPLRACTSRGPRATDRPWNRYICRPFGPLPGLRAGTSGGKSIAGFREQPPSRGTKRGATARCLRGLGLHHKYLVRSVPTGGLGFTGARAVINQTHLPAPAGPLRGPRTRRARTVPPRTPRRHRLRRRGRGRCSVCGSCAPSRTSP